MMNDDLTDAKAAKQAKVAAAKARKEARRAWRRKLEAEAAETLKGLGLSASTVDVSASKSNANRPLPAPPEGLPADSCTICLFYQYKEPAWMSKEHKAALNKVTEFAKAHNVTGRGRCAPEGLNCTLTASANDIRAFCYALRDWDPAFNETDFKLEDGIENKHRFRTFTLRKVDELVGYALDGIKAPSLNRHAGEHLEATEYHKHMEQKDTVIIDVRNAYESDIGHFQPPEGGAELLDPKMRTSQDFPKWLNAPATKEKLKNKTVMMYCTGGIRCERATALLNQITDAEPDFKTKGVVMVRGGIERYLKTFKEGGYWKGKNYLFDKRMEQGPPEKSQDALNEDIESNCCLCNQPHAQYRGQHKCARIIPSSGLPCAVPVIVCNECQKAATDEPQTLACPLCIKGYQTPETAPDLVGQKRKLGLIEKGGKDLVTGQKVTRKTQQVSQRLFVGKLPLTTTASKLRKAFGEVDVEIETIQWIVDRDTKAFYGSVFCQMANIEDAIKAQSLGTIPLFPSKKAKKQKQWKAPVAFAPLRENELWPLASYTETEYPPLG
uniref:Rhodanese domain-containing protein n=1 Tax=Pseudo-nitzschia australis TaxID=44445 RepID=A0A6U9YBI8_9STRA|mmetsp:Transcript_19560/g.42541  ORF Transcript_19560/g.42541 Transcript_19560/m.42541 type:complete len:553 (-) Transcript_19560:303-1961(-)